MFPMGHCKALFEEICKKTDYAKARIFEQGGHQAMNGNIDEFVRICDSFLRVDYVGLNDAWG